LKRIREYLVEYVDDEAYNILSRILRFFIKTYSIDLDEPAIIIKCFKSELNGIIKLDPDFILIFNYDDGRLRHTVILKEFLKEMIRDE